MVLKTARYTFDKCAALSAPGCESDCGCVRSNLMWVIPRNRDVHILGCHIVQVVTLDHAALSNLPQKNQSLIADVDQAMNCAALCYIDEWRVMDGVVESQM